MMNKEEELRQIIDILIKKLEESQAAHTKEIDTLVVKKFDEVTKGGLIIVFDAFEKLTKENAINNERVAALTEQIAKWEERNAELDHITKLAGLLEKMVDIFGENQKTLVEINARLKKLTKAPSTQVI